MTYSVIGLLAIIIHLIINTEILLRKSTENHNFVSQRDYCNFLYSVIAYHATDTIWGVLYEHNYSFLLYWDTVLYFILMALGVMLWTVFVVRYLERNDKFSKILLYAGRIFFVFQVIIVAINLFDPILFYVTDNVRVQYHASFLRYVTLIIQIFMFSFSSLYTIIANFKSRGSLKRRYFTVAMFGVAMIIAIIAQIFEPLLPFYSMGYMLGGCVLHTFVVEDEKDEYLRELEEALRRYAQQKRELGKAKHAINTDILTGARSKNAYIETVNKIDLRISLSRMSEFAVGVFDVNGLKRVNDTLGHEAGNKYIISAFELISNVFRNSPVFRIGGDEFVVILERNDYKDRDSLLSAFNQQIENNLYSDKVIVSAGCSEFEPQEDKNFVDVFKRADSNMYRRKKYLKDLEAEIRGGG